MEGYSVTEAASVLGVPTERVWELLARGVLSGAPDGETGMRVFLQPRPAPAPNPLDHARTDSAAGPGRSEPAGELSPFRELLTEFRNLTERYGQALLALGEARGEVATLRSRVDLLEARMDLRLPAPAPMAPEPVGAAAWPDRSPQRADAPAGSERASQAPSPVAEDDEHEPRPRRRRQRATEKFAEALARADDPTAPDLPEAGHAITERAVVRASAPAGPEPVPEAALPRELPAAEPIDLAGEPADAPTPRESTTAETPAEAVGADGSAVTEEAEVAPEPAVADAAGGPEPDAPYREPQAVSAEPPPVAARPLAEEVVPVAPMAPVTADEPATGVDDRPPIEWDPERYTVEVAEPDWFEAETDDAEVAPPATRTEAVVPPPAWAEPEMSDAAAEEAAAAEAETEHPDGSPPGQTLAGDASISDRDSFDASGPPGVPSPDPDAAGAGTEETMLWFGRAPERGTSAQSGADEMEVVGGAPRTPILRGQPAGLPGGSELHEALSALEALARDAAPPRPSPVARASDSPREPDGASTQTSVPPPEPQRPELTPTSSTPATRAYRRLRRIFPG